ncbi:MAG: FeoB small GTPase domain-containing protein [Bacillota bacterium]|nr:FeoB small GTPase domain-containing protein [Bacillota bacterium]
MGRNMKMADLIQEKGIKQGEPITIALAGNPNTGKSTLFNALTGLRQHTGNWPGKTVLQTHGYFSYKDQHYKLMDLPGTYSLIANSADEEVARDFLCFGRPDLTIVVVDATCLERNLNLVLQVTEITSRVIVCLNLMDEAKRKGINIDVERLGESLGIPVIPTAASKGEGISSLLKTIYDVSVGRIIPQPVMVSYPSNIEDMISCLEPGIIKTLGDCINSRWLALRLIDNDYKLLSSIQQYIKPEIAIRSKHFQEVLA